MCACVCTIASSTCSSRTTLLCGPARCCCTHRVSSNCALAATPPAKWVRGVALSLTHQPNVRTTAVQAAVGARGERRSGRLPVHVGG